MIPFARRKPEPDAVVDLDADADAIEVELDPVEENDRTLTNEDFVLQGALPAPRQEPARGGRRPSSRLSLVDPLAESSVADECLATIAAAVSHVRASDPLIAIARVKERSPVDDLLESAPVGSLPPAITPRRTPASGATALPRVSLPLPHELPDDIRETIPVRKRSRTALPTPTPFARMAISSEHLSASPSAMNAASLAPLVGNGGTGTIVVRARPRLGWVVMAAAIGALAAATVMQLASTAEPPRGAQVLAGAVPPKVEAAPPAPVPQSPSAAVAPAAAPTSAAVVQFGENDGAVIRVGANASAPAPPAPAPPIAKAAKSTAKTTPLTPDEASPKRAAAEPPPKAKPAPSVVASAATAPPPAPAPSPTPKKPLTPSQELAEAQLRAASR